VIIIQCPYCGERRSEQELSYGGEAGIARPADPAGASDQEWTDYLYMRPNPKGWIDEQWCCTHGCGQWFKVRRHSVTHAISHAGRFDWPFPAAPGA
jgi:sarcosine oxidase subunit delta